MEKTKLTNALGMKILVVAMIMFMTFIVGLSSISALQINYFNDTFTARNLTYNANQTCVKEWANNSDCYSDEGLYSNTLILFNSLNWTDGNYTTYSGIKNLPFTSSSFAKYFVPDYVREVWLHSKDSDNNDSYNNISSCVGDGGNNVVWINFNRYIDNPTIVNVSCGHNTFTNLFSFSNNSIFYEESLVIYNNLNNTKVKYLNVPQGSMIINAKLNLSGFNLTYLATTQQGLYYQVQHFFTLNNSRNDSIINSNSFNLTNGTVAYSVGKIGQAINQSGIWYNGTTDINLTQNLSVCFWLQEYNNPNGKTIFGIDNKTDRDYALVGSMVLVRGGGGAFLQLGLNDWSTFFSYGLSNTHDWVSICAIKDELGSKFYVNGVYVEGKNYTGSPPVYGLTKTVSLLDNPIGNRKSNASIDEFAIWNKSLTPAEVLLYHNSGNGISFNLSNNRPANISQINSSIQNLTITLNGTQIYYYPNSFVQSNNRTNNFAAILRNYLNNCPYISGTCYVPFEFRSDSSGILQYSDLDFNDYGIINNSASFNVSTYETATESLIFNFTIGEPISVNGTLYYNNTAYTSGISCNGHNCLATNNLDIPLVNSAILNNSFYWTIITNNGTSLTYTNSSIYNQTVYQINITNCTQGIRTLNFTLIDETTNLHIDNTTHPITLLSSFRFWYGDGDLYKTYAFQVINSSLSNSYNFCILPNQTRLNINLDIQYSAVGYSDNRYTLRNYQINNVSQNITLSLLQNAESTKFYINLKDGTTQVDGGTIDIWKYFTGEGIYKKVQSSVTDSDGRIVAYLDIDQDYKYNITAYGINFPEISKTAVCTVSPCEIDLNIGDEAVSSFDDYYAYFAQNVVYNLTYNKNLSTVNLSFYDKLGTANYWRLWVYKLNYENDTIITICDQNVYFASGTIGCSYSGYMGDIIAKVYISRSPEKLVDFITFVNENATSIFGPSGILASIIILLVILFSGVRNPVVAMILLPVALVVLKFIGLMALDWGWIAGVTLFCIWIIKRLKT